MDLKFITVEEVNTKQKIQKSKEANSRKTWQWKKERIEL